MNRPRILFTAPSSGSGKTMITCAILKALCERGMNVSSFKCGPDYIDPMFHEKVIGTKSGNLDLFFASPEQLKRLFIRNSGDTDISVIEGVMGYYDGLSAASAEASSYAVASALECPAVLIVDSRGQSLSALAVLKGFMAFREESCIRGVIFNRMSEGVYSALKSEVEKLGIKPLGYVPKADDMVIESRHLGLVTPGEIKDLSERLKKLAALLEKTVDIDALIELAGSAPEMELPSAEELPALPKTKIAVAKDEAFCFFYKDNLALLEDLGAELLFFSPIHDSALPQGAQGLVLYGGYPELYAKQLSENESMRRAVAEAIAAGMPCLAECGGFMYLHREMEDMNGDFYPMAGVIDAKTYRTNRLGRFGYITLTAREDTAYIKAGESIRGHEFHYFDSESCGEAFAAEKPVSGKSWRCIHADGNLLAGYPHMFYGSNAGMIERFLRKCSGKEQS